MHGLCELNHRHEVHDCPLLTNGELNRETIGGMFVKYERVHDRVNKLERWMRSFLISIRSADNSNFKRDIRIKLLVQRIKIVRLKTRHIEDSFKCADDSEWHVWHERFWLLKHRCKDHTRFI